MSNSFLSPLKSEFCRGADVVLERLNPHPIIGYSNPIMPIAALREGSSEGSGEGSLKGSQKGGGGGGGGASDLSKVVSNRPNPLQRQYVFYRRTPEQRQEGKNRYVYVCVYIYILSSHTTTILTMTCHTHTHTHIHPHT